MSWHGEYKWGVNVVGEGVGVWKGFVRKNMKEVWILNREDWGRFKEPERKYLLIQTIR